MIKDIFKKFKTNPDFKQKVLKGAVFFFAFVIGMIALFINTAKNQTIQQENEGTTISGSYFPADTTNIVDDKNYFYSNHSSDSINKINNTENFLTNSVDEVTDMDKNTESSDRMLQEYMNRRQKSIDKMNASSGTKRKYNAYGNSNDWTTVPTTVTSTRNTGNYVNSNSSYTVNRRSNPFTENHQGSSDIVEPTKKQEVTLSDTEKKKRLFENGKISQSNTINAVIKGSQNIKEGQTIVFRTTEEANINGVKVPKNTAIYGITKFEDYRVSVTIHTINVQNNILPVNIDVYSIDGIKGIPVNTDQVLTNTKNEIGDEVGNEITKRTNGILGSAGRIAGSLLSKKNRQATVKFIDNQKVLLMIR